MNEYGAEKIRNIVLVGHSSSGKTSLAEALLFNTGAVTRLGKVDDNTSVSDFDPEEQRRKISINTTIVPCEWNGYKINLLDTPGYIDFAGEVKSALRVADCVIVVVDAVSGVEVGTEVAWRYADEDKLPRFVVINKLDRDNANFAKAVESVEEYTRATGQRLVKVQLPIGEKHEFKGVIDLISMKAFSGDGKTSSEIPAELKDAAEEAHFALVEAAAEGEDALLEKYLEAGSLSDEELIRGLKDVVHSGAFIPVLCTAGGHEVGVGPLLNAIVDLLPNPAQMPARTAQGKGG